MKVTIYATKDCSHAPLLEKKLQDRNVDYELKYVEDNPGAIKNYQIYNSPNIVIDNEVVFRASPNTSLPSDTELKKLNL